MSLGLEPGTVRVVPYDPAWPEAFAAERARLLELVGPDLPIALEHIGSTAVPGLPAKPVIDILAGFPAGVPVAPFVAALRDAGYDHRGPNGIPGREYFRRGEPRRFHLHLVARLGPLWRDHLAFRDALRARPALRDEYAALKLALAERFPHDRASYTSGKDDFVARVVAGAPAPAP